MPLEPGDRLGPYEIVDAIGAGGMGEVFRARDVRLHREVAIKVLHRDVANDPARLQRFEIEARAVGALNHPNLLVLFDVGIHGGAPFVVTELLAGETVRQRLQSGPLPIRDALDIATQVARGLAAAHEKGIVHRDLKPENLFLLPDRRVKILDFGLAKLMAAEAEAATETAPAVTEAGQTLGTVGYMAPEQVSGGSVGPAADLFALGAVLYEMINGERAFRGETRVDVLHAILRADPLDLPAAKPVPPALDRVLRRCLSKRPDDRFRSAHDLAFALEMLSSTPSSATMPAIGRSVRRRWATLAGAACVVATVAGGAAAITRWLIPAPAQPTFTRVTLRRQGVGFARFAPDGQTILYDATQQEGPHELYSARVGAADSRAYGLRASILAVSRSGELALKIGGQLGGPGTLARLPFEGGSPREVLTDVAGAAWTASGDLAVVHAVGGSFRLEVPIGTVRAEAQGMLGPFASPDGNLLAFSARTNAGPVLHVLDVRRPDPPRPIFAFSTFPTGVCWGARGEGVLYVQPGSDVSELRSVNLSGRDRWLLTLPGNYVLQDCRADGAVIVERMNTSGEIAALLAGADAAVDLSWLNDAQVADVSADGRTLLFAGGTAPKYETYLRRLDAPSAPVRLGEGFPTALSPDGQWALVSGRAELLLLPVGAGEPHRLPFSPLALRRSGFWMPDGKHIAFIGAEPGRPARCYLQSIDGGGLEPLTPEGTRSCGAPSPDGRQIIVDGTTVFDLATRTARPLAGVTAQDTPLRWSADGSAVYVATSRSAAVHHLSRVSVPSGHRTFLREIRAAGPIGGDAGGISDVRLSADGQVIAYTVNRYFSELTVIEGLK